MNAFIGWAIAILVLAALAVVLWARFYERSTRETSLVRTGAGGRRVVMDGGVLALPYFHQVSRVNMQSLRLELQRSGEAALITKDRLRVDVGVEFHVSVIAAEEGIARAAQTLGTRTFDAARLRELIEGKLIDALRAVAARFTMDELHENRGRFVGEVRDSLAESLARNGLELDAVSLTALDQTPFRALDENNAFNAVGMRKLAEVIAKSKKERAEIDADADVAVRRAAMDAARRKLQIDLEEQSAQIAQVQQIETLKAAQLAEVVKRKADSELESARARIAMEQQIRDAEISRERDVALAEQQGQIEVARHSHDESRARAAADAARAEAVAASEAVATARALAEAERRKAVALVAAAQDAEIAMARARSAADAQALAAVAKRGDLLAQAEGQRALAEADNLVDAKVLANRVELAKIETLPRLVAEMVRPAEKIESIRIHHVSGLERGAAASAAKPPVNQALDSIMDMALQLPALKKIGDELGLSLDTGLAGVADTLRPAAKDGKSAPD